MLVSTLLIVLHASGLTNSRGRVRFGPRPTPYLASGVDKLQDVVQEGRASIDSFPWFGLLIYPIDRINPTMTTVILISNEIALSTALEIDAYPKEHFRARSRVILGSSCTGPHIIVRDYAFHPGFTRDTFSSLALLQLDPSSTELQLFPICAPPENFSSGDEIYALTVADDCSNSSMVVAYQMEYVESTECRNYYKRMELDIKSMWPTHWVCARSPGSSKPCVWRSGTALVIRHDNKWKLLGVGISGPGCKSPSRFLDYGLYHSWVTDAIAGIGEPTISKIASNHLILRRTNTIPRYGRCDPEETKVEIYSDKTTVVSPFVDEARLVEDVQTAYFNVTLLELVEYHCIVLQVWNAQGTSDTPTIKIRRRCAGNFCPQSSRGRIDYCVEIKFKHMCTFKVAAYGIERFFNDPEYE
ncbi:hypothetical protein PYW07_010349 [Mythimna separata]|uniref:Peptidase S1 domain-containing protein n=1 Tax=Mythimna separata TaxID=271217 RepID=A0AAD8DM85_MYTSE|nr:hypothetical protein PYW07_010349 [Mythimna separata]